MWATLVGCGVPESAVREGPTYYADVAPILDAHCAPCHVDGGVASFPLTDAASAVPVADRIAAYTKSGSMPPWPADPACVPYDDALPLSADQVRLLADWADAGAPLGDPADAIERPADLALDRVDVPVPMPEAYTPTTLPWESRCFVLEWPGGDTFVTGLSLAADAVDEVRSAVVWKVGDVGPYQARDADDDGPGWACGSGPGVESMFEVERVGAWTAGQLDGRFPAGTGIPITADDALVLLVRYRGRSEPDRSTVELQVDPTAEPARWLVVADPAWDAGGFSVPADLQFTMDQPAGTIRAVSADLGPHGTSARLTVDETCLLDVPDWDADWRRTYLLAAPISGDVLQIGCTFDDDGTAEVPWGDGEDEERCLGLVYLVEGG